MIRDVIKLDAAVKQLAQKTAEEQNRQIVYIDVGNRSITAGSDEGSEHRFRREDRLMNKLLAIAAMVMVTSLAYADEEHISIHEFHLGMTQTEWKDAEALYDHIGFGGHKKPRFSVGGQYPLNDPTAGVGLLAGLQSAANNKPTDWSRPIGSMTPKFVPSSGRFNLPKGLSGEIVLRFSTDSFDAVKEALLLKYPNTECVDKPVQNAMGAQFTDTFCKYETPTEVLTFVRFADGKVVGGISGLVVWQIDGYKASLATQTKAKTDL